MQKEFSFLKDERAVAEIRKHQWIKSQKVDREIGFATAALDWIKKFGEAWKKIHLKEKKDYSFLFERRKFRRYKVDSDIELDRGDICVKAKAKELNFIGILCRTKEYFFINKEVAISFFSRLHDRDMFSHVQCKGVVSRVVPVAANSYEVFLRFNETGRRYMEDNLKLSL